MNNYNLFDVETTVEKIVEVVDGYDIVLANGVRIKYDKPAYYSCADRLLQGSLVRVSITIIGRIESLVVPDVVR